MASVQSLNEAGRGQSLPNLPWEDRPGPGPTRSGAIRGTRSSRATSSPRSNSIFNSAVVPFDGGFAGVFRVRRLDPPDAAAPRVQRGRAELAARPGADRVRVATTRRSARSSTATTRASSGSRTGATSRWCNGYHGPTIGVAWTTDFETFHQLENAFLPFNRNGVLFPRKIDGSFAMLSRPSDDGHTPFGDIFYSESPDLVLLGPAPARDGHRCRTRGSRRRSAAGPAPIETREGWLLLYHGVLTSCNGFVYSAGVALLDLDEPWKVVARAAPYILSPADRVRVRRRRPERRLPVRDALSTPTTGRLAIYYGAADTVTGLAFAYVDELVAFAERASLAAVSAPSPRRETSAGSGRTRTATSTSPRASTSSPAPTRPPPGSTTSARGATAGSSRTPGGGYSFDRDPRHRRVSRYRYNAHPGRPARAVRLSPRPGDGRVLERHLAAGEGGRWTPTSAATAPATRASPPNVAASPRSVLYFVPPAAGGEALALRDLGAARREPRPRPRPLRTFSYVEFSFRTPLIDQQNLDWATAHRPQPRPRTASSSPAPSSGRTRPSSPRASPPLGFDYRPRSLRRPLPRPGEPAGRRARASRSNA